MTKKGNITEEDCDFVIIPVSINTENTSAYSTSIYLKDIVPYVETPAMANLHLDKAKIKFTYSTQKIIF